MIRGCAEITINKWRMTVCVGSIDRAAHEIRKEVRLDDVEALFPALLEIPFDAGLVVSRLANRLVDD